MNGRALVISWRTSAGPFKGRLGSTAGFKPAVVLRFANRASGVRYPSCDRRANDRCLKKGEVL
jgi:hypothetical protein